ncbi:2-amino-4-hydroxy-6-hydroxymethyldihydropteridine diphosphokinase [uncultured Sphingomonas sp.]|uniref:2-amino-4-hydroxy-6- hydroxymethyldihydropteridine diphosphokinase n=1 Tax=uncultured Sphingomonas sp. TaxID=158754 RepID=UPI0035CBAC94
MALYAIALGSNRRGRHGNPAAEVRAAAAALGGLVALSPVVTSAPVGPSARRYANAAALIRTNEPPPVLLARLKAIERRFGRRRGRRWGARVIDLDITLWSGGRWRAATLVIPHRALAARVFVLGPLAAIAPGWREPATGLTVRQLLARLTRPRPLPTR